MPRALPELKKKKGGGGAARGIVVYGATYCYLCACILKRFYSIQYIGHWKKIGKVGVC